MSLAGDLAIVGLACRFPGADSAAEFWDNLCAGRESIVWLTDEELRAAGVSPETMARPSYVKAASVIPDIDRFDARFFGVSADEARVMDPQQRILLELAYAALEDAGAVTSAQRRQTGVFATAGGITTSYLFHHAARLSDRPHGTGSLPQIGNDKDFLATRISFKLNLTGLSLSIQTACSSSLVALHLARTALLMGDIDIAIVGASCIRVPSRVGYDAAENPILSPDGHCRAFSDDARGTIFGSGAGVVVLKRQADAVRDRDSVYALVKSTAVNNDGGAKIGYTASSVPGQAKAMARAITDAGLSAADISFVECHGTATRIGDPLELKALERVFRLDTDAIQSCGIGSVKTNIGHLEQAAGIAGLIKVALMLKHRTFVPSLHYVRGNATFDFARSPFVVINECREWTVQKETAGRVAGLNSLGIGGTNGFAILAEAATGPAALPEPDSDGGEYLLCLSAKSGEQLRAYCERMASWLEQNPGVTVAEFCYTVNISRSHHRVRCCAVVSDRDELADLFRVLPDSSRADAVPVRQLIYVCNPTTVVTETTVKTLATDVRLSVFRELFAEVSTLLKGEANAVEDKRLADLRRTLACEFAIHGQLRAWGIRFDRVIGIGLGRIVADLARLSEVDADGISGAHAALEAAIEANPRAEGERLLTMLFPGGEDPAQQISSESADPAVHTVFRARPSEGTAEETHDRRSSSLAGEDQLSIRGLLDFLAAYLPTGREFDWESYYRPTPTGVVSLPTYPFSRDRHWLDE